MFWFKANNSYKKEESSWSSNRHINEYIYNLNKFKFNSSLVSTIYETTGYWFLKNNEEYGSAEYKEKEKELEKMKLYIVEVGNYILDISKETYDKILNENQIQNVININ